MTKQQLDSIAKRLGHLQGQKDIDEITRLACVDAVEAAVMTTSSQLNRREQVKEFRSNAKSSFEHKVET